MTKDLRDVWALLELSGPSSAELRVQELDDVGLAAGYPLLGVDDAGQRHLLMPVPSTTTIHEDKQSAGVQIVAHRLVDRNQMRLFVDVVCRKPHLHDLFSSLAVEIVAQLHQETGQPDLISRAILDRWRELLEGESSVELSDEKLAGLFGELWYLRELARYDIRAVNCWVGPYGARHDFSGPDIALEVKSTTARYGRLFEIHGEMQLEPPAGGSLYLATLKLEETPAGGDCAVDLLESIIALGASRRDLLTRLASAGIQPNALEQRRDVRFRVMESRVYEVSGEFPRITPASFASRSLPAGVLRVNYQIDLAAEPPYPLSENELFGIYTALTAGVGA